VALLVACGGSDKPAYCQDRDDLKESIEGLGSVDVRENGVDALTDQLQQVKGDADALVRSTQDEFGEEADALRSAVATLGTSVRDAAGAPSAQAAGDVAAQIGAVQDALGALSEDVDPSC
jgi:ElaB/YqjD/DUF883 family membrane-anchored ribosome-binding protein